MSNNTSHNKFPENLALTCQCCWDDIDNTNYVEYLPYDSIQWLSSGYCMNCCDHLLSTQYELYVNSLAKTTCKAEQRRLIQRGPPINLKDSKALPCPDDKEVYMLWYISDEQERSAKLTGSLTGEVFAKYIPITLLYDTLYLSNTSHAYM